MTSKDLAALRIRPPQHDHHFFTPITGVAPVFVVGQARSGTTMLRLMLNASPDLSMLSETWFATRVWARRWAYPMVRPVEPFRTRLLDSFIALLSTSTAFTMDMQEYRRRVLGTPPNLALFLDVLGRMSAEQDEKPRWGEKSPIHVWWMSTLLKMFPNARFVHIVRDPRDVAVSLSSVAFRASNDPVAFAIEWVKTLESVELQLAERPDLSDRLLQVRYEQLVAEPEGELQRICEFAQLAWTDRMVAFHEQPGTTIQDAPWMQGVRRSLNASSIGRFRDVLNPDDIEVIEGLTQDRLRALGYEPSVAESRLDVIGPALRRLHLGGAEWDAEWARQTHDHVCMHRGQYRQMFEMMDEA